METNISNKCKAYTSLKQSKKLAGILPIGSADHHYVRKTCDFRGNLVDGKWSEPKYGNPNSELANYMVQNFTSYEKLPCWSLAALLEIIPYPTLGKHADETWSCASWVEKVNPYLVGGCDSPINACYEMILKLNEQKLL